jgi:hypothetical protein
MKSTSHTAGIRVYIYMYNKRSTTNAIHQPRKKQVVSQRFVLRFYGTDNRRVRRSRQSFPQVVPCAYVRIRRVPLVVMLRIEGHVVRQRERSEAMREHADQNGEQRRAGQIDGLGKRDTVVAAVNV